MYPGGKNGPGVFQSLINQIPAHSRYIEAFVGSGAVYRHKRPCPSIVIDADEDVAAKWAAASTIAGNGDAADRMDPIVIHGDAARSLRVLCDRGVIDGRTFIYCDPPYVLSTRVKKRIYRHEMTDAQHAELLALVRSMPALIMVSGYRSALYDDALAGWRRIEIQVVTHGGPRIESLWMNYPEPSQLADFTHLGRNFRERERIKRRQLRWKRRLDAMHPLERAALLAALRESEIGKLLEEASPEVAMLPVASSGMAMPTSASPETAMRTASPPVAIPAGPGPIASRGDACRPPSLVLARRAA